MGEKPTEVDEAAESERTNLNSSKSNVYREGMTGGEEQPDPVEGTNLNSSKSNLYRTAEGSAGDADETAGGGAAALDPDLHRPPTVE